MTELRPLDMGFMELEDTDRHISLGIGAVAIMAGPVPTRSAFDAMLAEGVDRNERLRQRVRRSPLDLTAPVWEQDPDFALAHHIRWTALPGAGDEPTLRELVATELEERLDRDHPLWQCVVVDRVSGGRWALIVKAHHSMVDGVSGMSLFERLCDPPEDSVSKRTVPSRASGVGLVDRLVRGVRDPWAVPRFALTMARGLLPVVGAAVSPAPSSSLNGPIGRQRRYAIARASLTDVHAIGTSFEVTVNDVVLAAVASAYRTVLSRRGEEPTAGKVRVLVPVSVRAPGAEEITDNRVSAMIPYLPIELADPIERLTAVHERIARHRARGEAGAQSSLLAMAEWVPHALVGWTFRLAGHFPQRSVAALVTNVVGPRRRLTFHGREVLEILPCVPLAMRLRTTIAVLSYRDCLIFGITGDFDTTPDIDNIADGIEREIAELSARASRADLGDSR
ncbi:wax ester/triacylglycerol synthase family O-acyltransferase [Nocardia salmonicida]|uniref:wax ester/triacylglycerol synthase family O-acyltransferase n=1 Tax=Nocardia salmonicida TaxID=53431 RepID=UPI0007A4F424|nr:wax ester/triacylglycerol synthase family O-acyltransferase [Nocardia salmonicida]